ncbi:hypothetical protein [Paenibacillus amylolyticus]|uniref:hypothetical protein n=1 Tax=Paenibacillus amylolyticus TaxID=1451 RepID=UPI003EB9C201
MTSFRSPASKMNVTRFDFSSLAVRFHFVVFAGKICINQTYATKKGSGPDQGAQSLLAVRYVSDYDDL